MQPMLIQDGISYSVRVHKELHGKDAKVSDIVEDVVKTFPEFTRSVIYDRVLEELEKEKDETL